jgi:hypothetical protein
MTTVERLLWAETWESFAQWHQVLIPLRESISAGVFGRRGLPVLAERVRQGRKLRHHGQASVSRFGSDWNARRRLLCSLIIFGAEFGNPTSVSTESQAVAVRGLYVGILLGAAAAIPF